MNLNEDCPMTQTMAQLSLTTVQDLNNDCLLRIFRHLNIEDLVMASDTCQRFQKCSFDAYKMEWRSHSIWLRNDTRDNQLASTAILHHFGNILKNIFVDFGGWKDDHFFEMIIEKCSRKQLTELELSGAIFNRETIRRFADKFSNLKCLSIVNMMDDPYHLNHFAEHFPKLQHLKLEAYSFDNGSVEQFIRLNPQIKCLSLLYHNHVENVRTVLESIDRHVTKLERLEFNWMRGVVQETEYRSLLFTNLKELRFNHFDNAANMQHLSIANDNLEILELELGTCDMDVINFICNYKQLKHLSIQRINYPFDYRDLLKLNEFLTKLKTLEISTVLGNINRQPSLPIIEFVLASKQLTMLTISDEGLREFSGIAKRVQMELGTNNWRVEYTPSKNEISVRKLLM